MERIKQLWQKLPTSWRLAGPGLLLLLGIVSLLSGRPDGRLHLYFLDVGQGNAVLLRTPAGRWVLIDGGPDATALLGRLGRRLPFWERELDLVLLTETEPERMAGPVAVLQRYRVRAAGRPARTQEGSGWARWSELLAEQGLEPLPLLGGAHLDLGDGVVLEVLYPGVEPLPGVAPAGGDDALVLRLRYGGFTALLPTAAGPAGQRALLEQEPGPGCTVLLVPRQAGTDALERAFLEAAAPAVVVVSAGSGDHAGPDARTLHLVQEAGLPLYRTDRQGPVEIRTDGQAVELWVGR